MSAVIGEVRIPSTFIRNAADILGETNSGLSDDPIVKETTAYAAEYDFQLPHACYMYLR